MFWLRVCSEGITPLIILDNDTVNHQQYIDEVLSVALKYGNNVFGDDLTFQQAGVKPHTHKLSQKWCPDLFRGLIDKDHWSPNSPYLNPLNYSIWDEFVHEVNWNKAQSKQKKR
ncbi:unnamed protein product [Rotaria socialis]|uniref:Uncharacterized protein n=1 Tax=Rotaria socialis TaxID=392032 RepID=A0A818SJI8_9BILA|nr:unnamed protein product [Rotaria socialis]CAF3601837.1 unnamed protein product [Rotaria socialis]CAF3670441.1 unnamed protein product [Rotaria socialis]CAF4576672.1 unnamed protein product [Rotaria socialis]CAF4585198.1 unnamed protein product [Rotaria socialis]